MKNLENLLRESGFTDYEIRTYLTLTQYNTCTADDISRLANIPLPRVYDTLGQLERKGFVMMTKTRPLKCKPLEFKKAFENLLEHKKKMLDSEIIALRERASNIDDGVFSSQLVIKPKEDEWKLWSIKGKRNLINVRRDYLKKAKKEILMFSGDASVVREDKELFDKIIKNGVNIKFLMKESDKKNVRENIERLKKAGVELKTSYNGPLRASIIDDKNILMMLKYGQDHLDGSLGSEKQFSYEIIIINNPVFVNSIKDYFNVIWDKN